jgi:hypothetical protein
MYHPVIIDSHLPGSKLVAPEAVGHSCLITSDAVYISIAEYPHPHRGSGRV